MSNYKPIFEPFYNNGWENQPSENTPIMGEALDEYDSTLKNVELFLANLDLSGLGEDYALLTEAGYSLAIGIDNNYVMTISLKNKEGTVLDSKSIDFPIESMVVNATYANGIVTFTLQNGNVLDVDISDLVRGLVPTSRTIAGVDLEDDITAEELKDALGMYDEGLTAGTLKPWLYDTEKEIEIGVYNGKPLYRKYIDITTSSQAYTYSSAPHNIENVEEIWINYSHSNITNIYGTKIPLSICRPGSETDLHGTLSSWVLADESSIIYAVGSSFINCPMHIFVEYTKTTDAEGSGNNLNPYGIYDAKLDDVKSSIASVSDEVDAVEEQIEVVKNNVFARLRAASDIDALDLPYAVLSTAQASTGTFPLGASKVGVVEVIKRTDQYIIQRYTDIVLSATYIRWYFADETGWRPWEQLGKQSDIDAINSRLEPLNTIRARGSIIYSLSNQKYGVLVPVSSYDMKNYTVGASEKIGVMGVDEYTVTLSAMYENSVVAYTDEDLKSYLGYLGYLDLTFTEK